MVSVTPAAAAGGGPIANQDAATFTSTSPVVGEALEFAAHVHELQRSLGSTQKRATTASSSSGLSEHVLYTSLPRP